MQKWFDTIDDLPVEVLKRIKKVSDLHDAVLGCAFKQDFAGSVHTGTRTLTLCPQAFWGKGFVFGNEEYRIRSSPRGKIGQPLARGEVRKMAVSVMNLRDAVAKTTFIHMWLVKDHAPKAAEISFGDVLATDTHGQTGCNYLQCHFFEKHSRIAALTGKSMGKNNFMSAMGSTMNVMCNNGTQRVMAGMSDMLVCASISSRIMDAREPYVPCTEHQHEAIYCNLKSACVKTIMSSSANVNGRRVEYTHEMNPETASDYIYAAASVTEQGSLATMIDLIADPLFEGARMDSLTLPTSVLLSIAVSVRLACNPESFNLPEPTPVDQFATSECATLFQSFLSPLLENSGTNLYAIDMVTNLAMHGAGMRISNTVEKECRRIKKERRKAPSQSECEETMRRCLQGSLIFLMRQGVMVCQDCMGPKNWPIPRDEEEETDVTAIDTPFGPARHACDPVRRTRDETLRSCSIGAMKDLKKPVRGASRSARQTTLFKILLHVEIYLRSGMFGAINCCKEDEPAMQWSRQCEEEWASQSQDPEDDTEWETPAQAHKSKDSSFASLESYVASSLNVYAVQHARKMVQRLLMGQPNIESGGHDIMLFAFSNKTNGKCAVCDTVVTCTEGIAFAGQLGKCAKCHRPVCFECRETLATSADGRGDGLLSCLHCIAVSKLAESQSE